MDYSIYIKRKALFNFGVADFFWFVYGCLAFVPLEVGYEGLWLGYFQIFILFILSGKFGFIKFIFYLAWCFSISISILFSNFDGLQNFVNPLFVGLIFIVDKPSDRALKVIIAGIYAAAVFYVIYMIGLLLRLNINSLFLVLTSRDWGVGSVIGFGNGLAILFSLAMILAFKQSKFILVFIFFVGGVLTTSRIPFFALVIISLSFFVKAKRITMLAGISLFLIFILAMVSVDGLLPSIDEFELLGNRMAETEDRFDVYNLAASKFLESPLFGIGAAKLPEYDHAHNSYLQVLLKYGVLGFLIWVVLWYISLFNKFRDFKNLDFILLFLTISLFQIGLHNPNALLLILIYQWNFFSSKT